MDLLMLANEEIEYLYTFHQLPRLLYQLVKLEDGCLLYTNNLDKIQVRLATVSVSSRCLAMLF